MKGLKEGVHSFGVGSLVILPFSSSSSSRIPRRWKVCDQRPSDAVRVSVVGFLVGVYSCMVTYR